MSEAAAVAPIDLTTEVSVPQGEVSRDDLVKILEDSRRSEPVEDASAVAAPDKPEPAKDPAAEKVSARIIANRRAELKAAEERKAIAAEREATAKEREAIAKERAEVAEHAKAAEALKAAKLSPSKALELLGMTPKEFLEVLAGEHEPQAIAARAAQGAQTDVQKLQARIDAMEAEAKHREIEIARRTVASNYDAATEAFLAHVDASTEKYPHLIAEHTPAEIASLARQTAEQHAEAYRARFNVYPDDEVIAEHLESQAKARAEALAERRARFATHASPPLSQSTAAVQGLPNQAAKPRTLTNGASATRASAPKAWSQADADAESIRLIEQLHASRSQI